MKKIFISALALLALIITSNANAVSIKIGTEGAYPPWNNLNAAGELEGAEIDFGNEACKRMNATCEWVTQDWDGIIPALLNGKYDIIIANHVLDKFCPSLLQPIPSLTIVNLRSNERLGKLTKPLQIPRHSKLLAYSDTNQVCTFRTVWDLFFVPLEIARVSFDDDENFFVHIQTIQDSDLSELVIPSLDFHINAD